jgi:hypothetical protein
MIQEIAQHLGYTGVNFVEPLGATAHKITGRTAVIYPYQHGADSSGIAEAGHPLHDRDEGLKTLGYCINSLLRERGILNDDASDCQFIVEPHADGPRLHLVDTENYRRQVPPADKA